MTKPLLEAFVVLDGLRLNVQQVQLEVYESHPVDALSRIELRDPDDWPILAAALALGCPIWTEDQDFFGAGAPTWTTDRVEIYLKSSFGGAPSQAITPSRCAIRAASWRPDTSSLRRMFETCTDAVLALITNSSAISRFVRPAASATSTSRSRSVSP
jgi:hypothetical protein